MFISIEKKISPFNDIIIYFSHKKSIFLKRSYLGKCYTTMPKNVTKKKDAVLKLRAMGHITLKNKFIVSFISHPFFYLSDFQKGAICIP